VKVWDLRSPTQPSSTEAGVNGEESDAEMDPDVDGVEASSSTRQPADGSHAPDAASSRAVPSTSTGSAGELKGGPEATLGLMVVPHCVLGVSTRLGGTMSDMYMLGITNCTSALGHAGPVRSVGWSAAPHELLASVGHDGLLVVWDIARAIPLLQRHEVAPYSWALDLAWSPVAPAIFVSSDDAILHTVGLRDGMSLTKGTTLDEIPASTTVWSIGCNAPGDRLACATSIGRLEIFTQERKNCGYKPNNAKAFPIRGSSQIQLAYESEAGVTATEVAAPTSADDGCQSVAILPETSADASSSTSPITVALGRAARSMPRAAKGSKMPPSSIGLRCMDWNPNLTHEEWLACGTGAGLVLITRVPR
jgi:WD40 repeat protein